MAESYPKEWGEPELIYKFRPGKGGRKDTVATAVNRLGKKPVIYVWKPEMFNVHVREHELYHTKNPQHQKK